MEVLRTNQAAQGEEQRSYLLHNLSIPHFHMYFEIKVFSIKIAKQ